MKIAFERGGDIDNSYNDLPTSQILRLLEENDPQIDHIEIIITNWPVDHIDLGRALSNNTNLRSLHLRHNQRLDKAKVRLYQRGILEAISNNRHLNNLELLAFDGRVAFQELATFLEQNENLKSFHFKCSFGPVSLDDVVTLVTALSKRKSPLEIIEIHSCELGDDGIKAMTTYFLNHIEMTPKTICLHRNNIGETGYSAIAEIIRNDDTRLEGIELGEIEWASNSIRSIGSALNSRRHPLNWFSFKGGHSDRPAMEIIQQLSSNPRLVPESLVMCGPNSFADDAMRALGNVLVRRNSPLELLRLDYFSLSNRGLCIFMEAFRENCNAVPRFLDFNQIYCIDDYSDEEDDASTTETIAAISELLRNQICSLERLCIDCNGFYLDDELTSHITEALKSNNTTTTILADVVQLTSNGWDHLANLLCDTTSIDSTYLSNHTLSEFGSTASPPSNQLRLYCNMNNNANKQMVGRMKVIHHHFACNFNLDQFVGLQPSLLTDLFHRVDQAFAERRHLISRCDSGEATEDGHRENNSLTIHYLMLKNNSDIVEFTKFRSRKRRMIILE